jgi:CheY-like chemotaxis protein
MGKILIVDDVFDNCQLLLAVIKRLGLKALCVTSGREALASIANETPSLVILDVMMPEMDGFAVLGTIRGDERYADVPVVMYSGWADQTAAERAKQMGAQGYLVKGSATVAKLQATVHQWATPG